MNREGLVEQPVDFNTPESSTVAAAEHTFAMMLALACHVPRAAQAVAAGGGLGKIGSEVARHALAFGMRVVASDPYVSKERAGWALSSCRGLRSWTASTC